MISDVPENPATSPCGKGVDEAYFRLVFQNSSEGAAIYRLLSAPSGEAVDCELVEANPAFTKHTGIAREDAVGKRASALFGNSAALYLRIFSEVALAGSPRSFSTFYPPLGKHFEVSVSSPKPNWVISLFSDISARIARENGLRESERKFRVLFESSRDATLILSEEIILDCNQATLEMLGLKSKEEILAKAPWDFCSPTQPDGTDSRGRFQAKLREAAAEKTPLFEWTFQREDGTCFPCEVLLTEIDYGGRPSLQAVLRDITQRKAMDERYYRAHRLESIGALASGIAHDLNNILAPISMSVPLLRELASDAAMLELIATIEEASARGSEVVREIVSFARGVGGAQSHLAPRDLVEQVGRIIRKTFPKSIAFKQEIPEGLWITTGDMTRLHQVLLNLCVNARDAMPEGGTLTVSAENRFLDEALAAAIPGALPGRYLQLTVRDTGSGMPEPVISRIFDPFFTTKDPGIGTGLGLAIVRDILKEHHGFIQVDSQPGKGSQFHLFLPASLEKLPPPPIQGPAGQLPQGNGHCVLLVDDEPAFLTIMERILHRNGYQVLTAPDGHAALEVFTSASGQIAAAITDLMMPHMDGVMLAKNLLQINPELPIIACSGYPEDRFLNEMSRLGISAFLKKPYQPGDLLNALGEAICRQER
jgi:PAS domain S-box-containing protein